MAMAPSFGAAIANFYPFDGKNLPGTRIIRGLGVFFTVR
jgi:hypothetical protein